ncbi:MAG: hypothetical protein DRO01_02480 [Thermoproteota archaeon]|nr:MAG: hypothetical protein DRO01_02480 [Candidatus Korarchaeota archaeon]
MDRSPSQVEGAVLSALLSDRFPLGGVDGKDLIEELERLAKAAAVVIARYGSKEWFIRQGRYVVTLPDVDPVWWVNVDWATGDVPGPAYVCLNRPIYEPSLSPRRLEGLERLISGGPTASLGRAMVGGGEGVEHLQGILLACWEATLRSGVPTLLLVDEEGPSLTARAVLPLHGFREEDVTRAAEAMELTLERLNEMNFPLARR